MYFCLLLEIRFEVYGTFPPVEEIIIELLETKYSERQGRLIDNDQIGSMERKKQEGYF